MSTVEAEQPILLIEDSPEDFETTVRAFRKSQVANPMYRCADGDEALDYLFRQGQYADPSKSPRPAIILLDLNMPGTNGSEVLTRIKQCDELKKIPVVVFTTSSNVVDVEKCYRLGANSYIPKPVNVPGFNQVVQRLKQYWFELVILPKCE